MRVLWITAAALRHGDPGIDPAHRVGILCAPRLGRTRWTSEVRLSRLRVSRRRALVLGGTVGLAGVLAACATGSDAPSTGAVTSTAPVTDPAALLDVANTCVLAEEETQGPYWFDVDSIRSDIREGRPGLTLALALRVHDLSSCSVGGAVRAGAERGRGDLALRRGRCLLRLRDGGDP